MCSLQFIFKTMADFGIHRWHYSSLYMFWLSKELSEPLVGVTNLVIVIEAKLIVDSTVPQYHQVSMTVWKK